MIFAPHKLQVKRIIPVENDNLGRPLPGTGGEVWEDVCVCRCDDNTTKEFKSENGLVYRPAYHIVCDGNPKLKAGEYIRCLNNDNTVRGEGEVYMPKTANYFNYSEIWV